MRSVAAVLKIVSALCVLIGSELFDLMRYISEKKNNANVISEFAIEADCHSGISFGMNML